MSKNNRSGKMLIYIFPLILILYPTSCTYYKSLQLLSNQILYVNETGIYFYDNNFNYKTEIKTFDTKLSSNDIQLASLSQYSSSDGEVILCKIKSTFYLFPYDLSYICQKDFNVSLASSYYNVIPYYKKEESSIVNFYFIFCYCVSNAPIDIKEYYFSKNSDSCSLNEKISKSIHPLSSENKETSSLSYLSCNLMYNNLLACFNINSAPVELSATILNPEKDFERFNTNSSITTNGVSGEMRSVLSSNKKNALICFNSGSVFCAIYNIEKNLFTKLALIFGDISVGLNSFSVQYFNQTNEYMVTGITSNAGINIIIFDENFNVKSTNSSFQNCYTYYPKFTDCYNIESNRIVYSQTKKNYEVIIDCSKTYNNDMTECNVEINGEIDFFNGTNSSIFTDNKTDDKSDDKSDETSNDKTDDKNSDTVEKEVIQKSTNITKEELNKNLDNIINNTEIGKKYEIDGDNYTIKISPINEQTKNSTNIEFAECENILRKTYGLSNDSVLTVLQIELETNNDQSLINQVEYAVYDENKNQLDLSVCKDVKIKINYEITNPSLIDQDLIKTFEELGVNVFNIEDAFFNDLCYPYSNENNTDLILMDRIKDIYQNYTMCDSNCDFEGINTETMMITCECEVKEEVVAETDDIELVAMIKSTFLNSNFFVIKCYKLVFSGDKSSNYGFWIFFPLAVLHIPLYIFYFIFGFKKMKEFIFSELRKNDYIPSTIQSHGNPAKKAKKKIKSVLKLEENNDSTQISMNQKKNNALKKVNNKKMDTRDIKSPKKHRVNKNPSPLHGSSLEIKNSSNKINKVSSFNHIKKDGKKLNKCISLKAKKKLNEKEMEEQAFPGYYNLIQLSANNKGDNRPMQSKYILNNFCYEDAKKVDKRGILRLFWICLLNKENILHTFFFKTVLEPLALRLCLFVFTYSCDFAFNALFYSNTKISDSYQYTGENLILYTLINNVTIMLTSTVLSYLLVLFLNMLISSRYNLEDIFRYEERKMRKNKNYMVKKTEIVKEVNEIITKIHKKNMLFLLVEFVLMLFFTYFIVAFCSVYQGTQKSWLYDSLSSFLLSILFECIISFLNAVLYKMSVSYKMETLYNIAMFLYMLG